MSYIEALGVHVTSPDEDPFTIEWLKFDENSPMNELIKTRSHAAYAVDNLEETLKGKNVIHPIFAASPTLKIAFIEYSGAVIELAEMK
ncbi:MAG: hypothetical protein LBU65_13965 [Planctomycetaceae bacterium]|jgi:hypothetical protein|nr:hypothetical protein [Planctomycetaceae bacterium]